MINQNNKIPHRKDIPEADKWDLSTLFKTNSDWEKALLQISKDANDFESFRGKLGESAENLLAALKFLEKAQQNEELVGSYAFLLTAGDAGDSSNQEKFDRYMMISTEANAKSSWFSPELQSIPQTVLEKWIERNDFENYKIFLQKEIRNKPYILSEKEERLMALHTEPNSTAHKAFSMLTNVDLDYGCVNGEPLTQTTWSSFMENSDRQIRKDAYMQFYNTFDKHKNTIAALYAGSVNIDICKAKARGFKSSIEKALFPDKVPISVYDSLVSTVRSNFEPLHRYYKIRRKLLKLDSPDELRHYDVYVPLVSDVQKTTPFDEAIEILREALAPLGTEYTDTLCTGLKTGWVDRYENKGKRSGAFSAGAYTGYPYILMNYKQDVLRDVFTLAHEGGHSMHSLYSAKSNPFLQYNYTIFEAEVASTFNEELLFRYYLKNETNPKIKNYLVANRAADIIATLYRQTMFAEYERKTHELVESGNPLSVDVLRGEYKKLLTDYFGTEMVFEETSDLECLRIPHFYNAFYVYKYATGISAALALAEQVTNGGKIEKENYFNFLCSGGSRYPIESLKAAGVDMTNTEPVQAAINIFSSLVDELEALV
jgi:oligoendopeptidase F